MEYVGLFFLVLLVCLTLFTVVSAVRRLAREKAAAALIAGRLDSTQSGQAAAPWVLLSELVEHRAGSEREKFAYKILNEYTRAQEASNPEQSRHHYLEAELMLVEFNARYSK